MYSRNIVGLTIEVSTIQDELNRLLVTRSSRSGEIDGENDIIVRLERRMKIETTERERRDSFCIAIRIRIGGSFWVDRERNRMIGSMVLRE